MYKLPLLALLLLVTNNSYANKSIKVRAEAAKKMQFYQEITLPAECFSSEGKNYYAYSDGIVEILPENKKNTFKKGELILAIDKSITESKKSSAEADFKYASLNLERDATLLKKNIISQTDFEKTKIAYYTAKQNLAEASKLFDRNIIYAPYDCNISSSNLLEGEMIKNGDFLLSVTKNNDKIIRFQIPQNYKIKDNSIKAEVINNKDTYAIENLSISKVLSPETKNYQAKGYLLKENNLEHNSFVTVNLKYNFHNSLGIPEKAVIKSDGVSKIYVVENGKAKLTTIETGDRNSDVIEVISSEITDSSIIITEGTQKLKDQDEIEIIK